MTKFIKDLLLLVISVTLKKGVVRISGRWLEVNPGLMVRSKVTYSSRTHSQLSQAMAKLGRTSYRYMKVAILGSRDQLCVDPAVMEALSSREKLHMCHLWIKGKFMINSWFWL